MTIMLITIALKLSYDCRKYFTCLKKNTKEAYYCYEETLKLEPHNADALFHKGSILLSIFSKFITII